MLANMRDNYTKLALDATFVSSSPLAGNMRQTVATLAGISSSDLAKIEQIRQETAQIEADRGQISLQTKQLQVINGIIR